MENILEVGQIVNSYGIKGFLKVVPFVDNNNQYKDFKTIYIEEKTMLKEFEVEEVKFSKDLVLLKLKGIDDINEAEKYKNLYLKAKREDIKLEDGAHFIVDLIGLDVFTVEGEHLGKLIQVLKPGANDVYVVKGSNNKEILLPVIPDVIKNIDINGKRIEVKLLKGLI